MDNKHTFSCTTEGDTITVTTDAVHLPDILERFEQYLRACGFSFEGHVTIDLP